MIVFAILIAIILLLSVTFVGGLQIHHVKRPPERESRLFPS